MNKILILLVVFFLHSCIGRSQAVSGQYLYYQSGAYWISFTNTKSCDASVRVNYTKGGLPVDTTITVQAGFTFILQLPAPSNTSITDIKFKSDGQCSTTGWTTVVLSTSTLPVFISKFNAVRKDAVVTVTYSLYWSMNVDDDVWLERSTDGRNFSQIHKIPFGENVYLDYVKGFAYYRIRFPDKVSNILVVPSSNTKSITYNLYTVDGKYIGTIPKGQTLPVGRFLVKDGSSARIIQIIEN